VKFPEGWGVGGLGKIPSVGEVWMFSGTTHFGDIFNKTIIPLTHVGYKMIIASASLAIYHLISNARLWNNC